jgi:ABC-type metal ion transport system substrate-binding protein
MEDVRIVFQETAKTKVGIRMKGMKKLLSVSALAFLALGLAACGNYEGVVAEKEDTSFIVTISEKESEEAEIHLTDITEFSGKISSYEELEEGDQVKVVPVDTTTEFPYILALKVIVEE